MHWFRMRWDEIDIATKLRIIAIYALRLTQHSFGGNLRSNLHSMQRIYTGGFVGADRIPEMKFGLVLSERIIFLAS
jgi:hypothetical protein